MNFIIILFADWIIRLIALLGGSIGMVFAVFLRKKRASDKQKIYFACTPDDKLMQNVCCIMYALAVFFCLFADINWNALPCADFSDVTQKLIEICCGVLILHISLTAALLFFYFFLKIIHEILELSQDEEEK